MGTGTPWVLPGAGMDILLLPGIEPRFIDRPGLLRINGRGIHKQQEKG